MGEHLVSTSHVRKPRSKCQTELEDMSWRLWDVNTTTELLLQAAFFHTIDYATSLET